jgi:pimeloyl-ACP methyl ester carboxylesterase
MEKRLDTSLRARAGVPESAATLLIDGIELAVAREGAGPPVVCLHAIGHGGGDYEEFTARMRDRFEIVRIDWPGHGRSGTDSALPSAERYSALLEPLLDRLGIREPIIIGNSIGGAAALLYAQRRPVRALVLCNSGGLVPVNAFVRMACAGFAAVFDAGARGASWYGRAFELYYRYLVLPSAPATAQRERIVAAGPELAHLLRDAWRSFGQPGADLRRLAISLDRPVWIAWAKRDRVVPYLLCKPCIKRVKNAEVTMFDAGHSAFLERPSEFAHAFLEFVAARLPQEPSAERGVGQQASA